MHKLFLGVDGYELVGELVVAKLASLELLYHAFLGPVVVLEHRK